ncbi:MAG: dephospho-CoA kinase [Clostridia bacterium]|nr:dephospho-CoA kinase [Clostridia bacterium]
MRLIGLCGRSGSGKGLFSSVASKNGFKVIDCDAVYKELVSKPSDCLLEIADNFGIEVIKDNALNRRYLAPIVFADKEKLNLLNEITHKHIIVEVQRILSQYDENEIVVIDAPTLFESGIDSMCDLIVGIIAPDDVCIERITARDGITEEEARSRLSNQPTIDFIAENSDCIIYNDSSIETFEKAILDLIENVKENLT